MDKITKQQGEKWLVLTRQGGGEIAIAEKDSAYITEVGVFVAHNDEARTTTFVPMFAIAWIRSYHPKNGRVEGGSMRAVATSSAAISHPPLKEIEEGVIVIEEDGEAQ